jgi:uncharacterized protein YndB with AHSA1/START domain
MIKVQPNQSMSKQLKIFKVVDKPAAKVWEVLITARHLQQWLCDRADIKLLQQGGFSLESPIPCISGNHTVLSLVPDQSITFDWKVNGYATTVILELESYEDQRSTRVKILHEVSDQFPADGGIDGSSGDPMAYLYSVWLYALDLLKSYLDFNRAQCRLGHSDQPLEVNWGIDLNVSAAQVFNALIHPSQIKTWNPFAGENIFIDPRPGGRYSWGWESEAEKTDGPDRILEIITDQKLCFSWFAAPYAQTVVSFELKRISDAHTYLQLRHTGFDHPSKRLMEWKLGWACLLHGIKYSFEQSRPLHEISGFFN